MARHSGHSLGTADIPVVLGMAARGDRNHDIAAWFGVNQGRIAEAKDGRYGSPPAAAAHTLPPSGAPGVKGRRLRATIHDVLAALNDVKQSDKDVRTTVTNLLTTSAANYDKHEA